jgi:uncharacterized protein (TIGR00297 family)
MCSGLAPALRNSVFTRIVANVGDLAATLTGLNSRWAIGPLLSVAFAGLAFRMRGVTPSGAAAGAIVCFILYLGRGAGAFGALVTVFALAWITTRLGYPRKQKLGIAERHEGRKASQVAANLGVATVCAALYVFGRQQAVLLLALAASLSEAAADTVSSEVGQAFAEKARLITTWEAVPPGTNGAVSVTGTLAGVAAAGIVTSVCVVGGLLPRQWLAISLGAGVLGMVVDSFLGAWLERRRLLNNDWVNFLSTLVAALTACWLS